MTPRWKPSVTVAAIIERDGLYLLVEEHTPEGLKLNNPAGHLEPGESPAQACAREVEEVLRGDDFVDFLQHMYGDEPAQWQTSLRGHARLRYITNCLTRIRYCGADGSIDLKDKGEPTADSGLIPWFRMPARASRDLRIVFGHWSTLRLAATEWQSLRVYPLDTGAVWGGELTAMRLEDGALFQVKSTTAAPFD